MRSIAAPTALSLFVLFAPQPAAAIKKIPYTEVKVEAAAPFASNAALGATRKQFVDAVQKKDAKALFALVSPDFTWTVDGDLAEDFDAKRDGLHNFKVAFGFRPHGKDADGNPADGFWPFLQEVASDTSLTPQDDKPEIACGPVAANVVDEEARDRVTDQLSENDEGVEWVYALKEITLLEKPTGGAVVARVSNAAFPIVSRYPAEKPGENIPASFYEVLLPSGKTGWIDVDGVDPLALDRICYGKDKSGAWKIVGFEQNS